MELLKVLAALLIYGVFHSIMAALSFKAIFATVFGERAYLGLYRLFYNIISVITLLPILGLMAVQPGATIWKADGIMAGILLVIQAMGGIGLIVSLLQIDGMRFLGIKQMIAYFSGEKLPLPPEPLSTYGVYRLVRHPLYLFSLMVLWASPIMTEAGLGLNIGATIYFAVGSILEERKLIRIFGADYVEYRKKVPWLIPFVRWG